MIKLNELIEITTSHRRNRNVKDLKRTSLVSCLKKFKRDVNHNFKKFTSTPKKIMEKIITKST